MERIPIFPLGSILFPHTDFGIHAFEERYRALVSECLESQDGFGVVLIRSGRDVGGPAQPCDIGTFAQITAHARLPDGRYLLEVEGTRRFRIESLNGHAPYPLATVSWLPEPIGDFGKARQSADAVDGLLDTYRARLGLEHVALPVSPVARSYVVAAALRVDEPEKQSLLEAGSADERLMREVSILRRELALLEHLESAAPPRGAERRSRDN